MKYIERLSVVLIFVVFSGFFHPAFGKTVTVELEIPTCGG